MNAVMKISVIFPTKMRLKSRSRENVKKQENDPSPFDFALKSVIITVGEKVIMTRLILTGERNMMERQERRHGL